MTKRIDSGASALPETPLECFAAALPFIVVLVLCVAAGVFGW